MPILNDQHRELLSMGAEILAGSHLSLEKVKELTAENIIRYSEPWRRQHVVAHMLDVFGFVVENADQLEDPRATAWAALDHDIIYRPWLTEPSINEQLSGRFFAARMAGWLTRREIRLAQSFIEATATHQTESTHRGLLHLLDGDMRILGADPNEFNAYDLRIRKEYKFVPAATFYKVRGKILEGFAV